MTYQSAAGQEVPIPTRQGKPRPLVTDQETIVVELPLTARPDDLWRSAFESRRTNHSHPDVDWVHIGVSEDIGAPVVRFRLTNADSILAAVDEIEKAIREATTEWKADPEIAELISKQGRIDTLQGYLDRIVRA